MAKRRKRSKSKSKVNLPMTMAMVLLYLTIFSVYLSSGLYAKYTASSSGQDGARVITFGGLTLVEEGNFEVNPETGKREFIIIPGVDLTKNVKVSFDGSEADTYIFVAAEMPGWDKVEDNYHYAVKSEEGEEGNKKEYVSLTINEKDWTYLGPEGNTHIFYQLVKSNKKITDVEFIAEGGKITVSKNITKSELKDMTGIAMNVTAYAAQASGFENATDAWESVSPK